jgi:predicted ATP-grasp superfamily ATP-dependent carboligase
VLAGLSRYCERALPWPTGGEPERVEYLLAVARTHGLRGWALFPADEEPAALLARNRDALSALYQLTILTPWETLRWAYDKRLTYRLAAELGIGHPRTVAPRDREDVVGYSGGYPAILKPAYRPELNRFTLSKAWPVADHQSLVARYDEAAKLIDPELIMIQETIPGGGECQFSFAALCQAGRPIASLVARRTRQWPMDFGRASTYVETIDDPEVEEIGHRVLAALRFDGIVELEFKRDPRDGQLKLLDINPRIWGWHTLAGRAGVDFPYLLWRMICGQPIAETRGRAGVRWVRALTDVPQVITEIRAGRLSPLASLGSLRGPIEFAVLAADDPVPALLELPATAYLLAKRRAGIARRPVAREPDIVGATASRRAEPS